MKNIRNLTVLVGLCLMLVTWGATRAKAQVLSTTSFTGTLTFSHQVQWGQMTLPAGDYIVQYGTEGSGGLQMVEVTGTTNGSLHGFARVISVRSTKAGENKLTCVRDGDTLIVSTLDIPQIGQAVKFSLPRGAERTANQLSRGKMVQVAEQHKAIERIPVKMSHQ